MRFCQLLTNAKSERQLPRERFSPWPTNGLLQCPPDIHMKRLVNSLPPEGSVRCLTVTEKQYASMKLLVGLPLFQEKALKVNQMLLF